MKANEAAEEKKTWGGGGTDEIQIRPLYVWPVLSEFKISPTSTVFHAWK